MGGGYDINEGGPGSRDRVRVFSLLSRGKQCFLSLLRQVAGSGKVAATNAL